MSIDISRRTFMGAVGAMVATVGAGTALAAQSEGGSHDYEGSNNVLDYHETKGIDLPWSGPGSADGSWTGTPDDIKALGGSTMPLDELNRRRRLYIESKGKYTKEDGTVVPAVYVKAIALLNTYGVGTGNEWGDNGYDTIMADLTEDEAQAFLDMPHGIAFSPTEFAVEAGYSLEDAERYCTVLADKAWIRRFTNDNGTKYVHIPAAQGVMEYHDVDAVRDEWTINGIFAPDAGEINRMQAGWYPFGPAPVTPDVVKGGIYPLDDLRKIWSTKTKFSLSPCTCRAGAKHAELKELGYSTGEEYDISDLMSDCNHHVETCLSCGEEAQFWIDHGTGREITYEEAMAVLDRQVEEGCVLNFFQSREAETICSCPGDCCGQLLSWKSVFSTLKEDELPITWRHFHRYDLEVDWDACVKCGACVERCPMGAVSMDGEDGHPVVSDICIRCGQCALTCPAKARWLVHKPEGEWLPYPKDIIELNNVLPAQRFEAGLIY